MGDFYQSDASQKIFDTIDLEMEILSGIYILKPPVFNMIPTNVMYGIDDLIKDMLKNNQA